MKTKIIKKKKTLKHAISILRNLAGKHRAAETKSRSYAGFFVDAWAHGQQATSLEFAAEQLERVAMG